MKKCFRGFGMDEMLGSRNLKHSYSFVDVDSVKGKRSDMKVMYL
jgi:hypothetical protein